MRRIGNVVSLFFLFAKWPRATVKIMLMLQGAHENCEIVIASKRFCRIVKVLRKSDDDDDGEAIKSVPMQHAWKADVTD